MTKPVLYTSIPSRGLTVQWLLEELGNPHELRLLRMDTQEHKAPEYLQINPLGRVPALVHNDHTITETTAICMYLAEQFGDGRLEVAADSEHRGDYLRWMFFGPATVEPAIAGAAFGFKSDDYQPFALAEEVADTLRIALTGREFLVGDRFTAADVVIGSALNWGMNMMPFLPEHKELADYWQRLEQRPAWQRVAAQLAAATTEPAG